MSNAFFHEGDDAPEPLAAPQRSVNATESFEAAHAARGAAARVVSKFVGLRPISVLKLAGRQVVQSIVACVEKFVHEGGALR